MNNEYYLYGLQRSGTNYLRKLIELNFCYHARNKKSPRSWKHRLDVPENPGGYPCICIYKNPYKWIESLHRNPEDFFEKQETFQCFNEDGSYNLTNVAKTYRHWIETWALPIEHVRNIYTLKYEDLIKDKKETLIRLSSIFKVLFDSANIIEPKTVLNSVKFTDDKKEYYLKSKETSILTREQIDEVNKIFDIDFMDSIGYIRL